MILGSTTQSSFSLLHRLKAMTVVVADTGDIDAIQAYVPRDATTNPSLIVQAARMPQYKPIVDDAISWAKTNVGGNRDQVLEAAIERLNIEFGLRILKIIPGRVSTEVDARLSYDTGATLRKARSLMAQYNQAGISNDRVLIKIASTWEGIKAAEILETEGIHCNLTLLFGMHQAVACAEANVTLISPFVGRILDWYKKETGRESYPAHEDPGVQSVSRIYNYYKKFDYKTEVMGASFRNLGEIIELAGCDLLTISPKLLDELQTRCEKLDRRLDVNRAKCMDEIVKIDMDALVFARMHAEDRMSSDKLKEGIMGFSQAMSDLETELGNIL